MAAKTEGYRGRKRETYRPIHRRKRCRRNPQRLPIRRRLILQLKLAQKHWHIERVRRKEYRFKLLRIQTQAPSPSSFSFRGRGDRTREGRDLGESVEGRAGEGDEGYGGLAGGEVGGGGEGGEGG